MRSHLSEATIHGFDVAWFTEHDWRRRRLLYRPSYSFVPHEEVVGGIWELVRLEDVGLVALGSGGRQVSSPVSPNDPTTPKASLHLMAASQDDGWAAVRYRVKSEGGSRANYRARIAGRTVSVDVLPIGLDSDAWGEVVFTLSHHPAGGSRPAGVCRLRYRLRTDLSAPALATAETTGIIDVPVTGDKWLSIRFDLTADAARAWPDIDPRDNSLHDIEFQLASRRRTPAEMCVGFLRFDEVAGYDAVGVEEALVSRYTSAVPDVLGLVGTEISLGPHVNQFGGTQRPYDYGDVRSLKDKPGDEIVPLVVDFIHASGGLASINHPSAQGTATTTAAQAIALNLLAVQAGGADILEVGYGAPAGLVDHLAVWDTLSRNAVFLTGNGASDDHSGQNWADQPSRYYTGVWTGMLSEDDLLAGLARGRVFVGYLGSFSGSIDMTVDYGVPMGAVAVSTRNSRTLHIDVTNLPPRGAVQVVRGDVDFAGTSDPNPNASVLRTLGARDLSRSSTLAIDTSENCFHRLQVVDSAGNVVAFGQPTWTMRKTPTGGIPPPRAAR